MPLMRLDNGIDIFYEELGSGDKYVLCTQVGHAKYEMERFLPRYGFHVFLLTNRGFGRSTHVREDYGEHWYDVFAEDVVAFADKLGIDRFVYSGASHGAGTGWHLVLNHPERVICFFAVVAGPHNIDESRVSVRQLSLQGKVKLVGDPETDDPAVLERRALNREADEAGLNEWCAHLLTQDLDPERVAFGFVFSDESKAMARSDEDFIAMLYRMMLDREPDAAGLENWVSALAQNTAAEIAYDAAFETGRSEADAIDQTRQNIYALFAASDEFAQMIANFGF